MTKVSIATCLLLFFMVASAVAAPTGILAVTACTGQGVTVTATQIDWLPAGTGVGCIDTVQPTNVTYIGGGPLVQGVTGSIRDLTFGAPTPIIDFMTFAGNANLHYDLTSIGPGVANTACVNSFNDADPVCAVVAGSPFVLRPGAGGTTVTLAAFGIARDAGAQVSLWQGSFSVDFAGKTPFQVQQQFLETGSITSGNSGSFVANPIPEPATFLLMGAGLLVAGLAGRRLRK